MTGICAEDGELLGWTDIIWDEVNETILDSVWEIGKTIGLICSRSYKGWLTTGLLVCSHVKLGEWIT